MPVATTSGSDTTEFKLETCEGGVVEIRRMTYGEYLKKREQASRMYWESQEGKEEMQGSMQLVNAAVVCMESAQCIVRHNLEDADGNPLDFRKPFDVQRLDPRIGDEIARLIDKMNKFEGEGN